MAKPTLSLNTPVGNLNWVFISGEGKEDLNGNLRYSASLYFNSRDELKSFEAELTKFWEDNKPKSARKPKSMGVYVELKSKSDGKITQKSVSVPYDTEEFDPTGRFVVSAWTGTTNKDGSHKVVKTYNAKGAQVALGSKVIGEGSRGRLGVAAQVYENGPNMGLTLYLNGIQLTKFVEFTGGNSFDAVDEDGWTGDDLNDDGMGGVADEASPAPASAPAYQPERKVKL